LGNESGKKSGTAVRAAAGATERPIVALCAGGDCRKRCEFAKIRDALDAHCEIVELKCVGICSGPVVVTRPTSDRPVVYARLRTKKQRRQLLGVAVGLRSAPNALAKLEVSKGKQQKTLRQVNRALRARA
jgi:hypothetical protein